MKTKKLVQLSLFSAIILVLASTPLGYIPLGFMNATTIHIPVILGSILLGPQYGAFLGFIFGLSSLVKSTLEPTVTSFIFTPFYTLGNTSGNFWSLVICFVPRILIGITPYYMYQLIKGRNKKLALLVAGIVGSLTNTILVLGGVYVFFGASFATVMAVPIQTLFSVIISIVAINGIPEALIAGLLTVAICSIMLPILNKE
ncbi:MAG: ECF transporter S component [Clostridia bacterium]